MNYCKTPPIPCLWGEEKWLCIEGGWYSGGRGPVLGTNTGTVFGGPRTGIGDEYWHGIRGDAVFWRPVLRGFTVPAPRPSPKVIFQMIQSKA